MERQGHGQRPRRLLETVKVTWPEVQWNAVEGLARLRGPQGDSIPPGAVSEALHLVTLAAAWGGTFPCV